LDIQSKEILLDALKKYQGTILFVSHDHDFVNELASHTVFLTPLSGHLYEGSYEDYLNQEELNTQKNNKLAKTGNKAGKEKTKDLSEEQRKQASRLESQIIKLEREIEKIEAGFGDLDYGTLEFDSQLKKLDQVKNQLKSVNQEWEALT
jgi:ATP-binding cassette subfamily F protein 3